MAGLMMGVSWELSWSEKTALASSSMAYCPLHMGNLRRAPDSMHRCVPQFRCRQKFVSAAGVSLKE